MISFKMLKISVKNYLLSIALLFIMTGVAHSAVITFDALTGTDGDIYTGHTERV